MGVRDSAELAAMFIFAEMDEEITVNEAQEILSASGEVDAFEAVPCIDGLCERGILYQSGSGSEVFVGITEKGVDAVEALSEKRKSFLSAINKAKRVYRKITTGVEYIVDMQKNGKGTDIIFEMRIFGEQRFYTKIYFQNSLQALNAYNRIDNDPDSAYKAFLTVTTGAIDLI